MVRRLAGLVDQGQALVHAETVLFVDDGQAELRELWLDYEEGRTAEGRFVKELDRLEMALQAAIYTRAGQGELIEEFAASAGRDIHTPALRALLKATVEACG